MHTFSTEKIKLASDTLKKQMPCSSTDRAFVFKTVTGYEAGPSLGFRVTPSFDFNFFTSSW
jgi:hypothetical protein